MHPARHAYIEAFFVTHLAESGVEVQSIEAIDWYLYLDSCVQARYGWTFPDADDLVAICPQILAMQTSRFDDLTFKNYLEAIGWLIARYADQRGGTVLMSYEDQANLLTRLEDELYDLSPPALAVYSRVQLSVLDS
jgi:hypothetical protein